LNLKLKLDRKTIDDTVREFRRQFKNLSSYKEKDEEIIIEKIHPLREEQALIKVSNFVNFHFAWGAYVGYGSDEIAKFLTIVEDICEIETIDIDFVDAEAFFISKVNMNHYEAIRKAFYRNSHLDMVFKNNWLDTQIYFRSEVENDRICVIKVVSNVGMSEILFNQYSNDFLQIFFSLGHTKNFQDNKKLSEIGLDNFKAAEDIINKVLHNKILIPLDKELEVHNE